MLAWSIEKGPYCLQYKSHTMMKAQVLADFIVECSFIEEDLGELNQSIEKNEEWVKGEDEDSHKYHWALHIDGATRPS